MYVYILVKEYYNNVVIVEQVFTSAKKAKEELDWRIDLSHKAGWTVNRGADFYTWKRDEKVPTVELVPADGNRKNLDRLYILKEKVC